MFFCLLELYLGQITGIKATSFNMFKMQLSNYKSTVL